MNAGIVVIGAGGHAKVCIELLRSMGENVAYCIGGGDSANECVGVEVLKGDEHIERLRKTGYGTAFVALGSNVLRKRLSSVALACGYRLANAISPDAVVSPSVRMGSGIAVMAGAVINAEARIDDLAIINTGATVDHDCRIGEAVHIGPQCALAGNVSVGAETFLGIGCKVIPGISIGMNVTAGAGAVVISDIEANTVVVGVPAQMIKRKNS